MAALTEGEIDELQSLLDAVPPPLEPLDVASLDGFLCGVIVQPRPVPHDRWLAHVTDGEGRALPRGHDAARLHGLVRRREAELRRAIEARQWFDPWVFEPEGDDADDGEDGEDGDAGAVTRAVFPWVAGFAAALETFPSLVEAGGDELNAPLALVYRHLDPDDLEDADALLAEIESNEPAADLTEAVEGLVRAVLLLADEAAAMQRR